MQFFEKQSKILELDKQEKLKILNAKLISVNESYRKYYSINERLSNITKMRNDIVNLSENISNSTEMIDILKKLISQKRSDLHTSSSILSSNTQNFKEKIQGIDKNK